MIVINRHHDSHFVGNVSPHCRASVCRAKCRRRTRTIWILFCVDCRRFIHRLSHRARGAFTFFRLVLCNKSKF